MLKTETFKGQKVHFKRSHDGVGVMSVSGEVNKYDGKTKYYDFGANKKEAFDNIKKKMRSN